MPSSFEAGMSAVEKKEATGRAAGFHVLFLFNSARLLIDQVEAETKKRKDRREADRKRQDGAPAEMSVALLASDSHPVPATRN